MKLSFGGGASEVGASFLMLRLDGKNIALDCGVRMSGDALPDFGILKEYGAVDCIVLSHAHMDHSGALPVLSREYPDARIYMTHATKDLVRILLYDSLRIMERRESEIPIYAEIHVLKMLDNIVCFSPAHPFKPFQDSAVEIAFYGAGHIVGAAGVLISGEEGSFFYSGDFTATPQRTVEAASFPKLRPDVAVFESTYGDRLHSSRDVEEERLIAKIASTTAAGGKLLIPAFSLGRAQEIILMINRAINKKQLPGSLKVFVDGMINDICRVFLNHPNYMRTQYGKRLLKGIDIFYNDNIIAVNRDKALRDQIVDAKDGLVIVSSSGMLTGGPSQWYAEKLAGEAKNAIALTGYQDEESPGRQLLELLGAGSGGNGVAGSIAGSGAANSVADDCGADDCGADDNEAADSESLDSEAAGSEAPDNEAASNRASDSEAPGCKPKASGGRVLKLGEKTIPVACGIGMYGLSAHADKTGILALAHALSPKYAFFNHGNEDVVELLGSEFQKEYNGKVYIPKNGEVFELEIRNKRKQAGSHSRGDLAGMPRREYPDGDDFNSNEAAERLWRFVLDQYGANRSFTLEDLYFINYGEFPAPPPATGAVPTSAAADTMPTSVAETVPTSAAAASVPAPATTGSVPIPAAAASVPTPAVAASDAERRFGEFRDIINKSPFFDTERKRPFIYHAVAQEELSMQDGSVMEVNAMLRLADEYFPGGSGLYRKGARFDEKKVLLFFNFPAAATIALADEVEAFEAETGWKAEISPECNVGAAEQLIDSLMGARIEKKVSFHRTDGVFVVLAEPVPGDAAEICARFRETTGLDLRIASRRAAEQVRPVQADKAKGQMEQNKVLALIDRIFADKPHKLYKKGLKTKDGIPGIELSFISPNIGSLYQGDIDWLMAETRWNMWINKEPNQHDLLKAARELLAGRNIAVRKASFLPESASVQVVLDANAFPAADSARADSARSDAAHSDSNAATFADAAAASAGGNDGSNGEWQGICDEFYKLTGVRLLAK